MTTFEEVLPVADAVLYEGYVLYPYRADDPKNAVRWQFGVLAPPAYAATDPSERSVLHAELLLDGRPTRGELRLRFLQVQRRTVERAPTVTRAGSPPPTDAQSLGPPTVERAPLVGRVGSPPSTDDAAFEPVDRLRVGDVDYLPFDEAVAQQVDVPIDIEGLLEGEHVTEAVIPGGVDVEPVPGGRLVRTREPVTATITTRAQALPGPHGTRRLTIEVANRTEWQANPAARPSTTPDRADALRHSLVAAHLLVRLEDGRFLSLTDPPEWAGAHATACTNDGVWPVLAGPGDAADLALCAPIILPDHPEVAPESTTQFCDATEVDELLSLRSLTLTDAEKRAVRGTDPRAAEVLDRVEGLPPELMDRLHGAIRYLERVERPPTDEGPPTDERPARAIPSPPDLRYPGRASGHANTSTGGQVSTGGNGGPLEVGAHVLLRPRERATDAQDLFLAGRPATVMRVVEDVEGETHLAVVLDDDPGRDVALDYGRFLYFRRDEVEPIGAEP